MDRKSIIYFLFALTISCVSVAGYAYEFEDPFVPMLPKIEVKPVQPINESSERIKEEVINQPKVSVQGILWGADKPMAIIDGDVYGLGAIIKGTEAKIYKIENGTVLVMVKTKIFTLSTKNKLLDKEDQ